MFVNLNALRRAGIGRRFLLPVLLAGTLIAVSRPGPAPAAPVAPVASVAPATPVTPKLLIENFHVTLLGVMKNAKRLGYHGRLAALTPEVARAFHLPVMTRIVAGRYWKKFTKPQKQALVKAFTRMTTATYAHRFNGYGGEKFRVVQTRDIRKKAVLVKAELVKTDGSSVKFDYLVKRYKNGWRVVDIYLDGTFSELAVRRSEYSSVLRRRGLDSLIRQINEKVAGYATTN